MQPGSPSAFYAATINRDASPGFLAGHGRPNRRRVAQVCAYESVCCPCCHQRGDQRPICPFARSLIGEHDGPTGRIRTGDGTPLADVCVSVKIPPDPTVRTPPCARQGAVLSRAWAGLEGIFGSLATRISRSTPGWMCYRRQAPPMLSINESSPSLRGPAVPAPPDRPL